MMKIYSCIYLLNIVSIFVRGKGFQWESDVDTFSKRSLSTYDHSDWSPGVYLNDHTAVLIENSKKNINPLDQTRWDEPGSEQNYFSTRRTAQASAKVVEKPDYQQSSNRWNDIQWGSVNRPHAPPLSHTRNEPVQQPYIIHKAPEQKQQRDRVLKYNINNENQPKSNQIQSTKEHHDQALLKLHDLTLKLHDLTVGNKETEKIKRNPTPRKKNFHKVKKPIGRPFNIPIKSTQNKMIRKVKKPIRKPPQNYKKKRRIPNKRKRVPPPKKKGFQKIKLELKMPKSVRRVADSAGETLDAVLALLVPGHEAAMRRRRDRSRMSLDDSIMTLAVSSGIMAAILAY